MVKTIIVAACLALAGCASATDRNPTLDAAVRLIWCDNNVPRRDATPETPRSVVDEINAHNRKGVTWCGWTP